MDLANDLHMWIAAFVAAFVASQIAYWFGWRKGRDHERKYFRSFWNVLTPKQRSDYSDYLLSDKP